MTALQPGQVARLRYGTKRSSSVQGRGVRRVRVVRAAHVDGRYKLGPIIVVEDLSDPDNPGQTKTLYVHRISEILGEPSDSGSTASAATTLAGGGGSAKIPEFAPPWTKRSRYDRRQPGARRLSWDDDDEPQKKRKRGGGGGSS